MIRHVVMWKLLDEAGGQSREANALEVQQALMTLPAKIAEISMFEVGGNINDSERACDVVLVATYASQVDLDTYSAHPAHQDVVRFIRSVSAEARVVDYIMEE